MAENNQNTQPKEPETKGDAKAAAKPNPKKATHLVGGGVRC